MIVNIVSLPGWARGTLFRPLPPPIFTDGEPTAADYELALALFNELDPASQEWYGGQACADRLQARL